MDGNGAGDVVFIERSGMVGGTTAMSGPGMTFGFIAGHHAATQGAASTTEGN